MRELRFDDLDALNAFAEEDFGPWGNTQKVAQSTIDAFAELTGDKQWIHVDVERAKTDMPGGTTIAHGFLTLSLMPTLNALNHVKVVGQGSTTNYGAKGLRFLAPVPAGSELHARSRLAEVEQRPKGTLLTWEMAVHVVGQDDKPALLYQAQLLYRP